MRILSVCWALYGIICLATAILMFLFSDLATFMFYPIASRVVEPVADPVTLLRIFEVVYMAVAGLSVVCGILGLLAAVTLPGRSPFGRKVALAAGFLSLSRIPLGVTLGVYTLVVLLPADSLSNKVLTANKSDSEPARGDAGAAG